MGAAIVLAGERRYVRLVELILAVLLHGLEHRSCPFYIFGLAGLFDQGRRLSTIQPTLVIAMVILAIGIFAILVLSNFKMRGTISPPPVQAVLPVETVEPSETM
jgi:hypothetical protein